MCMCCLAFSAALHPHNVNVCGTQLFSILVGASVVIATRCLYVVPLVLMLYIHICKLQTKKV